MNAIKDRSTDANVMAKWPDSPEYEGDAGREISSLAASTLYLLAPLLGLGKKYLI
jgi:hypothetical protein